MENFHCPKQPSRFSSDRFESDTRYSETWKQGHRQFQGSQSRQEKGERIKDEDYFEQICERTEFSDPLLKELSTPALDPNKSQDYSQSVTIPADIQTGTTMSGL